jgi:hypothetical protein
MSSEHDKLLLRIEVRWLSLGNVLSRLLEPRSEVQIFLPDATSDLCNRFTDEMWLSRLVCLADIFCRLNELSESLQGSILHHSQPTTNKSFQKRPAFIIKEAESGQVSSFPFLDSFISENEIQLNPELAANIKEHCQNLIADVKEHIPENMKSGFWIRDPSLIEGILPESVTTKEKDELIQLSCDGSLQNCSRRWI